MTRRWFDPTAKAARLALPFALALLVAAASVTTAAQDGKFSRGLLWRVDGVGAPPSYLFGTLHSADPEVATPSATLKRILDSVDSLTIEMVIDEEAKRTLGYAMLLTDGRRLSDIAGPERFERVVETGARYGIPAENLEMFKPWGVMTIFSLPLSEIRRQASGEEPLDMVLQAAARRRGIPVYGIETTEEQVAVFSGLSEEDQLALLDSTLASNGRIDTFFEEMQQAYLAGDLARLSTLTAEEAESAPTEVIERFLDRLILDRNRRMAARIRPRLAEGNAMIAVGALHLYGEDGVLGLLEKQGYRVSQVE